MIFYQLNFHKNEKSNFKRNGRIIFDYRIC